MGPVRAIAMGSAQYGAKVMGIPDVTLNKLRSLVRGGTRTVLQGGSATIDLMLQSPPLVHPACSAYSVPLMEWARRVLVLIGA